MAERIGDFLVRTGALQPKQVEAVIAAQKAGDKRTFGDIAIGLGFCSQAAVDAYKTGLIPPGIHIRTKNERQLSQ